METYHRFSGQLESKEAECGFMNPRSGVSSSRSAFLVPCGQGFLRSRGTPHRCRPPPVGAGRLSCEGRSSEGWRRGRCVCHWCRRWLNRLIHRRCRRRFRCGGRSRRDYDGRLFGLSSPLRRRNVSRHGRHRACFVLRLAIRSRCEVEHHGCTCATAEQDR